MLPTSPRDLPCEVTGPGHIGDTFRLFCPASPVAQREVEALSPLDRGGAQGSLQRFWTHCTNAA